MVALEAQSSFGFQGGRWLGDVAPHLLDDEERAALDLAKQAHKIREAAEARIPKHLLFTKGWPTVLPTPDEAVLLGEVRQAVCDALGIPATYTRSDEIIEHYAQLLRGFRT